MSETETVTTAVSPEETLPPCYWCGKPHSCTVICAEHLAAEVTRLADLRRYAEQRKADVEEYEREIAESETGRYLAVRRELLANAKAEVVEAEQELRSLTTRHYSHFGDRRPHGGVSIRLYTILTYDEKRALSYARDHLPLAIVTSLNASVFEAVAKAAVPPLDFVTIEQEPRATIARDLSGYLPAEKS